MRCLCADRVDGADGRARPPRGPADGRGDGADTDDDRGGGVSVRLDDRGGGASLLREVGEVRSKIIDEETFVEEMREVKDVLISVAREDDSTQEDDLKIETAGGVRIRRSWLGWT